MYKINDIIYGIIKLNTNTIYGKTKNGLNIREFMPIYCNNVECKDIIENIKILIPTKKQFSLTNIYAKIKINDLQIKNQYNVIYGIIIDYLGDVGNINDELLFIKKICMIDWSKIDLNIDNIGTNYGEMIKSNINIYSIDPEGCTDIDDALHVIEYELYYEIGVHIADVSSYILENSLIDKEMAKRCESIYLPNETIHLVKSINDNNIVNILSLKEQKISRTYSMIFKVLKSNYSIYDIKFKKMLVVITKNLSYDSPNILDIPEIKLLYTIGNNINNNIFKFNDYDIHKMIEIYMLLTNHYAATIIEKKDNYILRSCIINRNNGSDSAPLTGIRHEATYINETNNGNKYHNTILENFIYTHFTSPIRRYVDIIVHRMLYNINTNYIDENKIKYINKKHDLYKKWSNYSNNLIKIYKMNENNCEILDCQIINLINPMIYIIKYDMNVKVQFISKSIESLFIYILNDENDELNIINKNDNSNIIIKLNQNIKICMTIILNQWNKMNIQLIDPDLSLLYYDKINIYDE